MRLFIEKKEGMHREPFLFHGFH